MHIQVKSKCRGVTYPIHNSPDSYCLHENSGDNASWIVNDVILNCELELTCDLEAPLLKIRDFASWDNQPMILIEGMYIVITLSTSYPHAHLWLLFKQFVVMTPGPYIFNYLNRCIVYYIFIHYNIYIDKLIIVLNIYILDHRSYSIWNSYYTTVIQYVCLFIFGKASCHWHPSLLGLEDKNDSQTAYCLCPYPLEKRQRLKVLTRASKCKNQVENFNRIIGLGNSSTFTHQASLPFGI